LKYRQAKWENETGEGSSTETENSGAAVRGQNEPLVFQLGHYDFYLPDELPGVPKSLLRYSPPKLPKVPEVRLTRHYVHLSQMNYGVDSGITPLGSCTMKYTPKVLERVARDRRIADLTVEIPPPQGLLKMLWELQVYIEEITGMGAVTLWPKAGSQGELTALLMVRKYFQERGEIGDGSEGQGRVRKRVMIPLTAHGSNFASAAMAGFEVTRLPVRDGLLDFEAASKDVDDTVAAVMLTLPNTYGLFEPSALDLVKAVHSVGGLAYYDGANMNAFLGLYRPRDMGFDLVQLNLHKTFASPHGGGGPGAGPVAVKSSLADYLPVPRLVKVSPDGRPRTGDGHAGMAGEEFELREDFPKSIGRISEGLGNLQALIRAYCYVRLLGGSGLADVARYSVLNANYVAALVKGAYAIPSPHLPRKHEFAFAPRGKSAVDVAKFLLNWGYAPSVHFPPELEESLMFEPTETEGKKELDDYARALLEAAAAEEEKLAAEPRNASVKRVDEVRAARKPLLTYRDLLDSELRGAVAARNSDTAP